MLGPWSARELARAAGASLRTLAITARSAGRSAVKNRLAALNSRSCCRGRRSGRNNRCFVDRPRACLRHHHAAGRRRRRCRRRQALVDGCSNGRSRCRGRFSGRSVRRGCGSLNSWRRSGRSFCRRCGSHGSWGLNHRRRSRYRYHRSRRRGLFHYSRSSAHGSRRLHGNRRLLCDTSMLFARMHRDGWLDCHGARMRRNHHHGPRRGGRCCGRRLGNHWPSRRTRGNRGCSRRRSHNGRSRPRLRHNPARFRPRRRSSGRCGNCGCGRRNRSDDGSHHLSWWRRRLPRTILFFLLFGQDGLHHIAGLGDMREINFRRNRLLAARGRARRSEPLAARQMPTHLLRFIGLKRTRVGFAGAQAELRQYVENLSALDFHLAREIVDSNLAHPPLFRTCCPPLSRS
jgi:hypothetical protein